MSKKALVIQYLKGIQKLYKESNNGIIAARFYKWLLKRGKVRKTKRLTKKELAELKQILRESGIQPQAKQCFYVSQMLYLTAPDKLKYIEGFANHIIPTEHAWLEYKGKVVDVVWGCLEHNKSPDKFSADPDCEYFGIEIPLDVITKSISDTGQAMSLVQQLFMKECNINGKI